MSRDPLRYPKLRWPIDIRKERIGEQEALLLLCPLGIAPQPLALVPAVGAILSTFEGNLSVDEIVSRYSAYGVRRDLVEQLIELLDSHLFLASPRFFEAEKLVKEEFLAQTIRPAALAGLGYAASAPELAREIDGHLAHALDLRHAQRIHFEGALAPVVRGPMVGFVSPHIDYRRGGVCYGIGWHAMRPERHDIYVLIGTSHQYSRHLFHLTKKHFSTPFGVLECERTFVDELARAYGEQRAYADEILHRREHSLELQLPFLQRLHADAAIVPILVGSFHRFLAGDRDPSRDEEYENFISALAELVSERRAKGQRVCFVAGVDMAHVGRSFGDSGTLSAGKMEEIAARDRIYLEAICKQQKERLLEHIAEDGDARRVCGFPTMYAVIDTLSRAGIAYHAEVWDYRQAVDYHSDCAVTFASAGLYEICADVPRMR